MIRRYLPVLLLCICFYNFSECFATVRIDSVHTTVSRCPNSGTITVFATTDKPPMLYSITAGPELRPYQSDSIFVGLFPGTYEITVTDVSGITATRNVIVKGSNYVVPDFSPTTKNPTCPNGSDGQIIGHPNDAMGRKPYSWVLTNINTGAVTAQATDTFNNLSTAQYTLRMYDSCQNFVTRTIYITNDDTVFRLMQSMNMTSAKIGCDSTRITFYFNSNKSSYNHPLKLTVYYNHTSVVHYVRPILWYTNYPVYGVNTFQIKDSIANFTYGNIFTFLLEDTCNFHMSSPVIHTPAYIFTVYLWYLDTASCTGNLGAILDLYHNVYPPNNYTYQTVKYPLSFTMLDVDSNKIVQSDTIYSGLINITPKVAGRNYLITIKDGCGQVYAFDTIWPVPGQVYVNYITYPGCIDSTAGKEIRMFGFGPGLKLEILSGPSFLRSTKSKYAYFDSIVYPKAFTHFQNGIVLTGNTYIVLYRSVLIKNLPMGTYSYRITDSCGHILNGSFTVFPNELTLLNHTFSFKKGCLGQNVLRFGMNSRNMTRSEIWIYNKDHFLRYHAGNNLPIFLDSLTSVDSGKYTIRINYDFGYAASPIDNNIDDCWIINDSVQIPSYERPSVSSYSIIYCNGNRYAELHPDSTKGIPPYQYEVISGPRTYSVQSSNVFNFIPPGDYVSRIIDACGNSNILNFGVDTLIFPPITKLGSSCLGGSVKLFYPSSPFFIYQWTKPDGSIYIGDTLIIQGVTSADTGAYNVTRYTNINNCKDTLMTTYHLTSNSGIVLSRVICAGQQVLQGTHVYTQPGTYFDTIPSPGCDTIYTLNLSVLPISLITIDTTICVGRNFQIGNHIYNIPGNYSDTLVAANSCDSIIILHLNIEQQISLQVSASRNIVPPGDTVQLLASSNVPVTFNWTSTATLNNDSIYNPIANINNPSWIYVQAIGAQAYHGCVNSDSVFIDIYHTCSASDVFIPNSFTPNNDGVNDIFKVRSSVLQSGLLRVYDRWGNKVFETNDLSKGWDGIYHGEPAVQDAYGYYFEGMCVNGETLFLKGNVTLLR